ncbi:MAG: MFS transporter [Candidatus Delongbacteria bacterium]
MIRRPVSLSAFLVLWSGQALSLLGSQVVSFALIWWLTKTTGSASVLAGASLAGLLPQVLLGPWIGVWVDRWNRRRTLLLADLAVALATLALLLLFRAGLATPTAVFVVLVLRSVAGGFHGTAMSASTSLMVPERLLTRIQGLNQMLQGGSAIVAAPLGALALELLPMYGVIAIDLFTAACAIGPLLLIAIPQPPRAADPHARPADSWRELREGLAWLLPRRGLLLLMGLAALINLLLVPAFSLLPLFVREELRGGAPLLAALESAAGAGSVAGGLLLAVWGGFRRRIWTVQGGMLLTGLGVLLFGLTPSGLTVWALSCLLLVTVAAGLCNGALLAILQSRVDPALQGRVFSLLGSLSQGAAPLGLALAGPAADLAGLRPIFVTGGLVCALCGVGGLLSPALRQVEDSLPSAA